MTYPKVHQCKHVQGEIWISTIDADGDEIWGCGHTMQLAFEDLNRSLEIANDFANDDTVLEDWTRVFGKEVLRHPLDNVPAGGTTEAMLA
jgi:hypothetical protein